MFYGTGEAQGQGIPSVAPPRKPVAGQIESIGGIPVEVSCQFPSSRQIKNKVTTAVFLESNPLELSQPELNERIALISPVENLRPSLSGRWPISRE